MVKKPLDDSEFCQSFVAGQKYSAVNNALYEASQILFLSYTSGFGLRNQAEIQAVETLISSLPQATERHVYETAEHWDPEPLRNVYLNHGVALERAAIRLSDLGMKTQGRTIVGLAALFDLNVLDHDGSERKFSVEDGLNRGTNFVTRFIRDVAMDSGISSR